jgi:hypothetical protein
VGGVAPEPRPDRRGLRHADEPGRRDDPAPPGQEQARLSKLAKEKKKSSDIVVGRSRRDRNSKNKQRWRTRTVSGEESKDSERTGRRPIPQENPPLPYVFFLRLRVTFFAGSGSGSGSGSGAATSSSSYTNFLTVTFSFPDGSVSAASRFPRLSSGSS